MQAKGPRGGPKRLEDPSAFEVRERGLPILSLFLIYSEAKVVK